MKHIFSVKIIPNASQNQLVKKTGDHMRIRLTASPTEGKANKALISFLSKELSVPKSSILIEKGHTSRTKTISIEL